MDLMFVITPSDVVIGVIWGLLIGGVLGTILLCVIFGD